MRTSLLCACTCVCTFACACACPPLTTSVLRCTDGSWRRRSSQATESCTLYVIVGRALAEASKIYMLGNGASLVGLHVNVRALQSTNWIGHCLTSACVHQAAGTFTPASSPDAREQSAPCSNNMASNAARDDAGCEQVRQAALCSALDGAVAASLARCVVVCCVWVVSVATRLKGVSLLKTAF